MPNTRAACLVAALLVVGCPAETKTKKTAKVRNSSSSSGSSDVDTAWAGTYTGESMKLVLEVEDGTCTGSVTFKGKTYPVQASESGDQLAGTFKSGESEFTFTLARGETPDVATLSTGGVNHTLEKAKTNNPLASKTPSEPKNPLVAGSTDEPTNPVANPVTTPVGKPAPSYTPGTWADPAYWAKATRRWKTYRYAGGFSMRCPPGWRVQQQGGNLTIFPTEDQFRGKLGLYVIRTISGDVDPRQPSSIDVVARTLVRTLAAYRFQRTGQIERADIGSRPIAIGKLLGANPQSGNPVHGRYYLTRVGGRGLMFFTACENLQLSDSKGKLIAMAFSSSFQVGRAGRSGGTTFRTRPGTPRRPARRPAKPVRVPSGGRLDPNLVGKWYYARGRSYGGGMNQTTQQQVWFRKDGVYFYGSRTAGSYGGAAWRSGTYKYSQKGRWWTANKRIHTVVKGKQESYPYAVFDYNAKLDRLKWGTQYWKRR